MLCVNLHCSLSAALALPANASLAERKSDEPRSEPTQPAPFSGQTVIRGEIHDRVAKLASLRHPRTAARSLSVANAAR